MWLVPTVRARLALGLELQETASPLLGAYLDQGDVATRRACRNGPSQPPSGQNSCPTPHLVPVSKFPTLFRLESYANWRSKRVRSM